MFWSFFNLINILVYSMKTFCWLSIKYCWTFCHKILQLKVVVCNIRRTMHILYTTCIYVSMYIKYLNVSHLILFTCFRDHKCKIRLRAAKWKSKQNIINFKLKKLYHVCKNVAHTHTPTFRIFARKQLNPKIAFVPHKTVTRCTNLSIYAEIYIYIYILQAYL